jgi:hypothetical protein
LRDIEATRKQLVLLAGRLSFEFVELPKGYLGRCCDGTQVPGVRGCKSIIQLSIDLYSAAENKDRKDDDNDKIDFQIAVTMLHELAHAASLDVKGNAHEDCFEESITKAGFELISHIFGLCPWPFRPDLRSCWFDWQSSYLQKAGYDLELLCYHPSRLPKTTSHRMDCDFVRKLFDTNFWDGDYARCGGVALLPSPVIELCRKGVDDETYLALHLTARKLWVEREGISYYREPCPYPPNENYEIRRTSSEEHDSGA